MCIALRVPGCPPRSLALALVCAAVGCGDASVTGPDSGAGPKEGPPVVWTSLSVGMGAFFDYACGVTDSGSAYCWGQFPSPTGTASSRVPVRVSLPGPVAQVEAGWRHACALTPDGKAVCWGWSSLSEPATGPLPVFPERSFRLISAGNFQTCGVEVGGELICWSGTNSPKITLSMPGLSFSDVSAGTNYACAVTVSGEGYCWGNNNYGQLGDGTRISRTEPVRVAGDLEFLSIASGDHHACGLTRDGVAYCWGWEVDYQSGPPVARGPVPKRVGGDTRFTSLSSGTEVTCGIAEPGQGSCWGRNYHGELGTGTGTSGSNSPLPVAGGIRFRILQAGGSNACGISTSGEAYCWGSDNEGQLGIGSVRGPAPYEQYKNAPTRVLNPLP